MAKFSAKKIRAVAALPTVLLVGGLVFEISIALALVGYFVLQSNLGIKLSAEALSAAISGIDDAVIKIVRDKSFSSTGGYTLSTSRWSANVVVCKDTKTGSADCDTPIIGGGKDEITSLGTALNKKRRLRAFINIDSETGEVKIESIQEITL